MMFDGVEPATGPVRLRLTTYRNYLIKDKDNLIGGAKPLLDALKNAGFIVGDSIKNVEAEYFQERCKRGEERTEIERWT
jgi:hypothetical protein